MDDEETTAPLNGVYADLELSSDPVIIEMQARSIEPEVWEEAPKPKSKGQNS